MASLNTQAEITFDYSTDGGSTWSTSYKMKCARSRVYKHVEYEERGRRSNGRMKQVSFTYARLELEINATEFDPNITATAATRWDFIQSFLSAPLRRIIWDSTIYAEAGGLTLWNSSNTYYMNVIEHELVFQSGLMEDGQPVSRTLKAVLQTRDII